MISVFHTKATRGAINKPQGRLNRILDMLAIRDQRRALKALDPYLLKDIGVTRPQAVREAQKPMWDVPVHWQR